MRARLLVTLDCNRDCPWCCNKHTSTTETLEKVDNLDWVKECTEVNITGGEPFLNPERTVRIIREIKNINPECKVFVYSALFPLDFSLDDFDMIDGLTYTLHQDASGKDVHRLAHLASKVSIFKLARMESKAKFRLKIHKSNPKNRVLSIFNDIFDSIEFISYFDDGGCLLPEDKLFLLDDAYEVP